MGLPSSLPIDTDSAPNFYIKYAKFVVDQEQQKLIDDYNKMTIATMLNPEKLDINADITDNQYYKNRNLMLMSKAELENMRQQEMAQRQETLNEYSKMHQIQRMKQFLEGCQVSRESSSAVNNKHR